MKKLLFLLGLLLFPIHSLFAAVTSLEPIFIAAPPKPMQIFSCSLENAKYCNTFIELIGSIFTNSSGGGPIEELMGMNGETLLIVLKLFVPYLAGISIIFIILITIAMIRGKKYLGYLLTLCISALVFFLLFLLGELLYYR